MKTVVIVESPIKAKTIQDYLDSVKKGKYIVIASGGHIKDLPLKSFAINVDDKNIISGTFEILNKAKPFIKKLKNLIIECDDIFICTDDDREGERICEDIVETLKIKNYYRYAPREIVKKVIIDSIVNKVGIRQIDEKVIEAQRVRRIEDRIYGYALSPIIGWYANKNGDDITSRGTGRVEAIALDILYQRHITIKKYEEEKPLPTEVVKAMYKHNGIPFELIGEKLEFKKSEEEEMEKSKRIARENSHIIYSITPDIDDFAPPPPFITSSMYSVSSYRYGFEPSYTKKLAQELFYSGAINYPRTDSYTLADEKVEDIIVYLKEIIDITEHDKIKTSKRRYKNKKGAQVAHEAIRPSYIDISHSPTNVRETWKYDSKTIKLAVDHFKLYELIWTHAITTQLIDSLYDTSEIVVRAGSLIFKDRAFMCIERGWEKFSGLLLSDSKRDDQDSWKNKEKIFPKDLNQGDVLSHVTIDSRTKVSRKPKRISQGMLISMLENLQVARPSTMHTIAAKIIKKGYAKSNSTLFSMTKSGIFVAEFVVQFAYELIDRKKATQFEEDLQKIENGEITDTNSLLRECWDYVDEVKKRVQYIDKKDREATDGQKEAALKIYNRLSGSEKKSVEKEDFNNFEKVSKFISNYKETEKREALKSAIGICPKCKKNSIVNKEKTFSCLTDKCDFILFKNGLEKFFKSMKKDFTPTEFVSIVSTILTDKVVYITGLETQYGKKDSYFELKYSKEYKTYSFSFLKKGKNIDSKLGLWEDNIIKSTISIDATNEEAKQAICALNSKVENLEETNRRLADERRKDTLTRAFNRIALESDLKKIIELKNSKKINNLISVSYFDADGFKKVNDTYGHSCGDTVLISIVDTSFAMIRYFKANASIYRLGGDEFVIIFYGHTSNEIMTMLDMFRKSISNKKFCENLASVTVSIGYSNFISGDNNDSMCDKADKALYEAKKCGKNQVLCYSMIMEIL